MILNGGSGVTVIEGKAFYNCENLLEIHYRGTKAQWKAIRKDINWQSGTGDYTLYCTDGNL